MNNYLEKFEKMRLAGKLAAETLDMLTNNKARYDYGLYR